MFKAYILSSLSSVALAAAILTVLGALYLVADLVLEHGWPCDDCGRRIDATPVRMRPGRVFECAGCGTPYVSRPHTSALGWFGLLATLAEGVWFICLVAQWRVAMKLQWLSALSGHAETSTGFSFVGPAIITWCLLRGIHAVYLDESDPDPDNRPRL